MENEPLSERFLTHGKRVHLDEATAFAELQLTRHLQGEDVEAVRDRSAEQKEGDWLVDRGGEYDPLERRLDHHQFKPADSNRPRRDNGVAYAAAGMQWKEIGRECITEVCKRMQIEASSELVEAVFQEIDGRIMQPIDAEDNGEVKTESQYIDRSHERTLPSLSIADLVRGLNIEVNESHSSDKVFHEISDFMEHFLHATIVKSIREESCREMLRGGERALEGKVVILQWPVPKELEGVLHEVEEAVEFAVFQQEGSPEWNIRAIPLAAGSFEFRKGLPEEWRGLLGEPANDRPSFAEYTGYPAAIFCHAGGFVAKAGDLMTVKALAEIAVTETER